MTRARSLNLNPLIDKDVEGCATYLPRCDKANRLTCDFYDPTTDTFVDEPPELLKRAMLLDRWRDLYNSPDGQAIDRDFTKETLPGTAESEWGTLDNFSVIAEPVMGGRTGWSVVSSILRYVETGTRAEYERMEQHVRDLLMMWDVTGIPGYLSRYHYLRFEPGAPKTDLHITRTTGVDTFDHRTGHSMRPQSSIFLPRTWKGSPMKRESSGSVSRCGLDVHLSTKIPAQWWPSQWLMLCSRTKR